MQIHDRYHALVLSHGLGNLTLILPWQWFLSSWEDENAIFQPSSFGGVRSILALLTGWSTVDMDCLDNSWITNATWQGGGMSRDLWPWRWKGKPNIRDLNCLFRLSFVNMLLRFLSKRPPYSTRKKAFETHQGLAWFDEQSSSTFNDVAPTTHTHTTHA